MTVKDLASRLSVHPETAYRLCRRGDIPHSRVGGQYRISEQQLQTYLQGGPVKAAPAKNQRTKRVTASAGPNWDAPSCKPRKVG